jgi:NAD(P)-dependent dehydrogenase (short-subunit alcohol dehydrogenase family)
MGDRLRDKGAVVTGAGRGIGREVALALAAEGAGVVVVDPGVSRDGDGFDPAPADEVVAEIKKRGGVAVANYSSVVDFKSGESIIKSCLESFGRLDILVNCAAIYKDEMFIWDLDEESWDITMKINLYGTFNCTRWAAGIMKEQRRGRIINFTSLAFLGDFGISSYAASKGAILGFSWSVARELGSYGVTCNMISPGAATRLTIRNEKMKSSWKNRLQEGYMSQEFYEHMINLGGPEHIAPIVVYLCTDEASNINGQIFHAEKGTIGIFSKPDEVKKIFNNGEVWRLEQLIDLVPKTLLVGYHNPAPPQPSG